MHNPQVIQNYLCSQDRITDTLELACQNWGGMIDSFKPESSSFDSNVKLYGLNRVRIYYSQREKFQRGRGNEGVNLFPVRAGVE